MDVVKTCIALVVALSATLFLVADGEAVGDDARRGGNPLIGSAVGGIALPSAMPVKWEYKVLDHS